MLTYLPNIGGKVLVKSIRLAFFIVLKLKMVSDFLFFAEMPSLPALRSNYQITARYNLESQF